MKIMSRVAKFISVIGHPLLTISLLVIFLTHRLLPYKNANIISVIIIGGITLPIIFYNLYKTKQGKFSNFDVSNQQERKKFYPFTIGLMSLLTIYFYFSKANNALVLSCFCFLMMLILFSIVNLKVKASLHAGINFYIVFILLQYAKAWGIPMFLFAFLILISRKILQRHSWLELICGAGIGTLFGIINSLFI